MGLGTEGGGLGRSGVMEGKEKIWGREKRDGCQEGGHKEEESSKFEMRNKIRFSQRGIGVKSKLCKSRYSSFLSH